MKLSHMPPALAHHIVYGCHADPEALSDLCSWLTVIEESSNLSRCALVEFGHRRLGSLIAASALACHVTHVLGLCAKEQMAWVATSLVVAFVKNEKLTGACSGMELPRYSVSRVDAPWTVRSAHVSIPVNSDAPRPLPAWRRHVRLRRSALVHLGPKALRKRRAQRSNWSIPPVASSRLRPGAFAAPATQPIATTRVATEKRRRMRHGCSITGGPYRRSSPGGQPANRETRRWPS